MSETILIVDDEHRRPGEAYPVAASAREWFPPSSGQPIFAPRLPANSTRGAHPCTQAILLRQAMQPDGTW